MESMRSLNTSLPRPSGKHRTPQPPEELLQAFKNAALSVTNLYRTAEIDTSTAKNVGYREAISDLLKFLDKENIGLSDGEGWRVREWATDCGGGIQTYSDSDEEGPEPAKPAGCTLPTNHRRSLSRDDDISDPAPPRSSPVQEPTMSTPRASQASKPTNSPSTQENFTFRSSHQLPIDAGMSSDSSPVNSAHLEPERQPQPPPSFTVNLLPRNSRSFRGNRYPQRSASTRSLGSGAGSKRRVPFGEYFDISNFDGLGGPSKRGRLG